MIYWELYKRDELELDKTAKDIFESCFYVQTA